MTPCLLESIRQGAPELQGRVDAVECAEEMNGLIKAVAGLVREVGVLILVAVLTDRAQARTEWQACPICGVQLRSKGWVERQLGTSLGIVVWRRRVGRCPRGCEIGQQAPLDTALGLAPHQRHSTELMGMASLLAVFVPFSTTTAILVRMTHVKLGSSTVWQWVQTAGQRALAELEAELKELGATGMVRQERLEAVVAQLVMLIGADGVMVPFRPTRRSPKGTTVWREVKVAILARLDQTTNCHGQTRTWLRQRRLVAVLGNIDDLAARLKLEAFRQGIATAPKVVWVSDGARGLWRLYEQHLAPLGAMAILDFYHTVGQIWNGAENWYFRYLPSAHIWLKQARHQLRHGEVDDVIIQLRQAANPKYLSAKRRKVILRVAAFLDRHRDHLRYPVFKQDALPLGSGFVESAVKWLIQQRFKGVGMRWSEDGFNHLLLLRLAWANDRFDTLFAPSPNL